MDYDAIRTMREQSAAWRLLRADNAPLILSFLGRVFVESNRRSVPATELESLLDDELYSLRERYGAERYPRTARAYLEEWAHIENGYVRRFYPPGQDEAHFDATPALEKAIGWLESLRARTFVGTRSRLNTVIELLRQMVYGAETDPQERLRELRRRRDGIDAEIERVESGDLTFLDTIEQRERYQQIAATAREVLADFREVEQNFRELDRGLREQIATWEGTKGELLDEVVSSRSSIDQSDQGRSFQSFYDLLLSHQRTDDLAEMLARAQQIAPSEDVDDRLARAHYDWMEACESTQSTIRLLSEQLRRFLDDQAWGENRRVTELARSIKARLLRLRDTDLSALDFSVPDWRARVALPLERPLYRRPARAVVDSAVVESAERADLSAVFDQFTIDTARLAAHVHEQLLHRGQVTLREVVGERPIEQGLAELVGYLALSDRGFVTMFDDERRSHIALDAAGNREAELPDVTYVRRGTEPVR